VTDVAHGGVGLGPGHEDEARFLAAAHQRLAAASAFAVVVA
jgi:hypothetical protein